MDIGRFIPSDFGGEIPYRFSSLMDIGRFILWFSSGIKISVLVL